MGKYKGGSGRWAVLVSTLVYVKPCAFPSNGKINPSLLNPPLFKKLIAAQFCWVIMLFSWACAKPDKAGSYKNP